MSGKRKVAAVAAAAAAAKTSPTRRSTRRGRSSGRRTRRPWWRTRRRRCAPFGQRCRAANTKDVAHNTCMHSSIPFKRWEKRRRGRINLCASNTKDVATRTALGRGCRRRSNECSSAAHASLISCEHSLLAGDKQNQMPR